MDLDTLTLSDGTQLDADVCIVGAGPAGLTLAREFAGLDVSVIILESGGLAPEREAQELNEGDTLGDTYDGLCATRNRQVGGSTTLWNTPVGDGVGAKYMPLDEWDFEEWPFDRSHLLPFYHRAQAVRGLGRFAYDGDDWGDESRPLLNLPRDLLATRVHQFGRGSVLAQVCTALRRDREHQSLPACDGRGIRNGSCGEDRSCACGESAWAPHPHRAKVRRPRRRRRRECPPCARLRWRWAYCSRECKRVGGPRLHGASARLFAQARSAVAGSVPRCSFLRHARRTRRHDRRRTHSFAGARGPHQSHSERLRDAVAPAQEAARVRPPTDRRRARRCLCLVAHPASDAHVRSVPASW